MEKYLVVYTFNKFTYTDWTTNNTKKAIKEVYKSNGLTVKAIFKEDQIQEALNDIENKNYFLLQDLKGNGII